MSIHLEEIGSNNVIKCRFNLKRPKFSTATTNSDFFSLGGQDFEGIDGYAKISSRSNNRIEFRFDYHLHHDDVSGWTEMPIQYIDPLILMLVNLKHRIICAEIETEND